MDRIKVFVETIVNDKVYVEIVEYNTGKVIKRMGPMTRHSAERVDDGVNINLNHEEFYTRIVDSVFD